MKQTSKAVATTVDNEAFGGGVAIDFSTYQGPTGLETVTQEDLGIPMLSLVQKGSACFDRMHQDYASKQIPGCGVGDIVIQKTKQIIHTYGEAPLNVIPIHYKVVYQEWKPRSSGGGFVSNHLDKDILRSTKQVEVDGKMKTVICDGERAGNEVIETKVFGILAYVNKAWISAILAMAGGNHECGRSWLSRATAIRLKDGRQAPFFSHAYHLSSIAKSRPGNSWVAYNCNLAGPVTKAEVLDLAQGLASQVKQTIEETSDSY